MTGLDRGHRGPDHKALTGLSDQRSAGALLSGRRVRDNCRRLSSPWVRGRPPSAARRRRRFLKGPTLLASVHRLRASVENVRKGRRIRRGAAISGLPPPLGAFSSSCTRVEASVANNLNPLALGADGPRGRGIVASSPVQQPQARRFWAAAGR